MTKFNFLFPTILRKLHADSNIEKPKQYYLDIENVVKKFNFN